MTNPHDSSSADAVRDLRMEDLQAVEDAEARILADTDTHWDEAGETARLLGELRLG